jgi:hypothetical protein
MLQMPSSRKTLIPKRPTRIESLPTHPESSPGSPAASHRQIAPVPTASELELADKEAAEASSGFAFVTYEVPRRAPLHLRVKALKKKRALLAAAAKLKQLDNALNADLNERMSRSGIGGEGLGREGERKDSLWGHDFWDEMEEIKRRKRSVSWLTNETAEGSRTPPGKHWSSCVHVYFSRLCPELSAPWKYSSFFTAAFSFRG